MVIAPSLNETMTQERFLKLLDNPDLLATISYEELKTLALTYPYAQNLRYLLAIKAGQEDHPDYSRNLATASAYSIDRTCLFTLIAPKKLIPKIEEHVPVLELKPIATVQRELDAKAPLERQTIGAKDSETKQQIAAQEGYDASEIPVLDLTQPLKPEQPTEPPKMAQTQNEAFSEEQPEAKQPKALNFPDMPSFSVWISRFNPQPLNEVLTRKAPDTKINFEQKLVEIPEEEPTAVETVDLTPQKLAEKSVTESKSILSETLAKLYVAQGYVDKAIDMYQRLSLAFPDKSTYFAGEIDKLKK